MMLTNSSALTRIYAWFAAVTTDDTVLLSDLLAHGMPIDTPHPLRHSTALMEATRLGRAEMVQWFWIMARPRPFYVARQPAPRCTGRLCSNVGK